MDTSDVIVVSVGPNSLITVGIYFLYLLNKSSDRYSAPKTTLLSVFIFVGCSCVVVVDVFSSFHVHVIVY